MSMCDRCILCSYLLLSCHKKTEISDIDLLVDYDLQKISPWFPGGLSMDLQDMLGCKVDIVTEQGLSHLIKDRVLADAKSLVDFTLKEAV
jgi:predicted nucleotidyltransferase